MLGFSCRDIAERIGVLEQAAMAFEQFNDGKDGFPTAQMGSIAVMRQGLHDGLALDGQLWRAGAAFLEQPVAKPE